MEEKNYCLRCAYCTDGGKAELGGSPVESLEARIRNPDTKREGYIRAVPSSGGYAVGVFYDGTPDPYALGPRHQPGKGAAVNVEVIARLAGLELL